MASKKEFGPQILTEQNRTLTELCFTCKNPKNVYLLLLKILD